MTMSAYEIVNKETKSSGCSTPFLKQLHVSTCVWTFFFIHGLGTGAPTVFVPQIRRDWNTTVTIDDDLASWFYSASNFAALPWIGVLPIVTHFFGRKKPFLACCSAITIMFILMYFSSAPSHILIAQTIQGYVVASAISIVIHMIPEYSNPRFRSMFLNIQCTTFYWGIWASNAIGTFFSWKYISVFGLMGCLVVFTIIFYPESPRWLASKGKFRECEAAHRFIYGCCQEAEKELRDLIDHQASSGESRKMTLSRILEIATRKEFYMPLFLVVLVGAQYNLSGKFVCSIYAIEFLKKITDSENAAYTGMLILDGVTVFGMYVGSMLSKIMKLRPFFFKMSLLSIIMMFSFSLYLYLVELDVILENTVVTLGFLVMYSLTISCGPIVLCISIYSEIISIRYEAASYVIASFVFLFSCTSLLKFTPLLFSEFGIHGTFLFFGISSGIATIFIYIYLPETKDKTLVEIEECFRDNKRVPESEALTKRKEGQIKN